MFFFRFFVWQINPLSLQSSWYY